MAYTDQPGSCLFFQEDITGSGSYRFKCPSSFGKIYIHLVASMIGLDDTVELKGNLEIQPSSFTQSSVGISQLALEKATDSQKQPSQSQSDIRQVFKSSVKTVADPRLPCARGGKSNKSGFKARHGRNPAPASAMTAHSDLRRNDIIPLRASVTPSPKVMNYPKNITSASTTPTNPKATSEMCQEFDTSFRTGNSVAHGDYHPTRTSKETPEIPRLLLVERRPGPLGGGSKAKHAESRSNQDRPLRSVENIVLSSAEKRGLVANTSWNQQRRKQQKQQGRAFNQKKDNPFASYQHDPNDAESHLESLCLDTGKGEKIIPAVELNALLRSSNRNPRPLVALSSRSNQKGRSNQRRRRTFSPHRHVTERDLLRLKADEQDAYAAPVNDAYAAPANPSFIHPLMGHLQANHGEFFQHETPRRNDYRGGPGAQHDLYSLGSTYPEACYMGSQASPTEWVPRVLVASRHQHNPVLQGFTRRDPESLPRSMSPRIFIDNTDSVAAYDKDYQSPSDRMTWESEDIIHGNEYSCFDQYNGSGQSGVLLQPTQDEYRDAYPDGIHKGEHEENDFTEAFF
jgi:hypothetical protein